jgi:hypothetical protein
MPPYNIMRKSAEGVNNIMTFILNIKTLLDYYKKRI